MNARQRRSKRRALAGLVGHLIQFRPRGAWNSPHLIGKVSAPDNLAGVVAHVRRFVGMRPQLHFVSLHRLRAVSRSAGHELP